jgi:hypothetical protein
MNTKQIIETAIQGYASTRNAIRWAVQQEREACALAVEQAGIEGLGTLAAAAVIRKRGNDAVDS